MAQCPVCQAEIEITSQHYGALFTCPQCSAVYFVDWGGQPEITTSESVASEELPPVNFEPPQENNFSSAEELPAYDFSEPLGEATPSADLETPVYSDSPDLTEIADFGNADLNQVAFKYTVLISGIDSGSLRTQVQEALTDSRFNWDVSELMTQIKGGVLTIRSVNAIKASILMQRVKYLPVKISWRQDVLSSTV